MRMRRGANKKEPRKPCVLCIAHLPPPVHGVTIMSELVVNSERLRNRFSLVVVPLRFADSVADIGALRFRKIAKALSVAIVVTFKCLRDRPKLAYLTLTPAGPSFLRDLLYVLILRVMRVPRLFHLHGQGISKAIARRPRLRALYQWAFKDAGVIFLSRTLLSDIASIDSVNNCFVLPNGIPDMGQEGGRVGRNGAPVILYFSNMARAKGPLVLIESLNRLRMEGVAFEAVFAGNWESEGFRDSFFETVRQNGLEDVIEYVGPKYGDDKWKLFGQSDVFVLPSFMEAFPLVVLEAMASSLPVVATNVGAIPDMIEEGVNGYLVEPRDPEALTARLSRLLRDCELRSSLGEMGRKRFLSYYTVASFENNLESVFCRVLGTSDDANVRSRCSGQICS
jgi:glycosyltransferase involved in cell wall biosynthesis